MTRKHHGVFNIRSAAISPTENTMNKMTSSKRPSEIVEPSADAETPSANTEIPTTVLAQFWLLKVGIAKKLGLRSTGSLSYQVLADHDRKNLFIALTQNDGGGFFSKERVNMLSIEACLDGHKAGEPFPSKTLKNAYKSKSSNNAGFMTATLRALGLTAAAPDAQSKHIVAGDWDEWRKKMIAEAGTLIELPADADDEKQAQPDPLPDHKEHKKTLGIPAKNPQ
jgi:hypothetical protein